MKIIKLKQFIKEDIKNLEKNRYERIVFMQGDEASEPLDILDDKGQDEAIEYLSQWHQSGNHEMSDEIGRGTQDNVYKKDGYILSWNSRIGYIGLEYDTYYDKYKKLFDLAKDKSGTRLEEYEKFLKNNFDDYLVPHIQDFINKSNSFDDFIKQMNRFESWRDNEYKK